MMPAVIFVSLLSAATPAEVDQLFGAPAKRPAVTSEATPSEPVAAPPRVASGASLWKGFAMVAVLGIGVAGAWWYRRRRLGESHPLLQRIAHTNIAPGQGIAVVEVAGELLVVSTGQGGVRFLHRLESTAHQELVYRNAAAPLGGGTPQLQNDAPHTQSDAPQRQRSYSQEEKALRSQLEVFERDAI